MELYCFDLCCQGHRKSYCWKTSANFFLEVFWGELQIPDITLRIEYYYYDVFFVKGRWKDKYIKFERDFAECIIEFSFFIYIYCR